MESFTRSRAALLITEASRRVFEPRIAPGGFGLSGRRVLFDAVVRVHVDVRHAVRIVDKLVGLVRLRSVVADVHVADATRRWLLLLDRPPLDDFAIFHG